MKKIIQHCRHWLLARPQNDHRPHILRLRGFLIVLSILIGLEVLFIICRNFKSTDFYALILPETLVATTNSVRAAEKESELKTNELLTQAAQLKANDMAEKGYFAHTSPAGLTPWHWLNTVGYDYHYAGENLAVNFNDSNEISKAWMNSPGHRANILNSRYEEIGVATATGQYRGREAVFVVQFFGTLKKAAKNNLLNKNQIQISNPTKPQKKSPNKNSELSATINGLEQNKNSTSTSEWVTNMIYGLVALAGCLAIFSMIRQGKLSRHPTLVANGLLVIAIAIGLVLVNIWLQSGAIV